MPPSTKLPPEQDFTIGEEDVLVHQVPTRPTLTTSPQDYRAVEGGLRYVVNDIALVRLPRDPTLNTGVQLACLVPGQDRSPIFW